MKVDFVCLHTNNLVDKQTRDIKSMLVRCLVFAGRPEYHPSPQYHPSSTVQSVTYRAQITTFRHSIVTNRL